MSTSELDTVNSPAEQAVRRAILDWAGPAFPLAVREEAAVALADYLQQRPNELIDFYAHPLRFGTGGLRGIIGNGAGRMNQWTVGRTTVGLCNFLKQASRKPALVIAYDSRRMSRQFSTITAGIAASMGLQVFLFDQETPTPLLSYAVRRLKATGGVVITASHNPPEYNGYKVYGDDGAQLTGEDQGKLEAAIEAVADWGSIPFVDENSAAFKKLVKRIGADIRKAYYDEFKALDWVSPARQESKKKLKVVYSPLHGTGGAWLPGLLERYGFHVDLVPEQAKPDGEFPTVKLPNPEEREALRLCEERSRQLQADIFLASDPDADRMGAGVRQPDGNYAYLNGNQLGSIMCAYLCERLSESGAASNGKSRWHVFKTIVTTDLQTQIARKHGVQILDVLTGFKYIAEQLRAMDESSHGYKRKTDRYLFGGEESYGYLPVDFVRDKDSLASSLLLCEILAARGDLVGYLNEVYLKYGLYLEDLKSVTMKGSAGQAKMAELINGLRTQDLSGWKLGERTVVAMRDYERQTRNGKPAPEIFGRLPASNVIQLELEPEGKLTIRPSGTEPKVKLYASLRAAQQPTSLEELARARTALEDELASVSGHFIARTGLAG
ncbi:MAG: phospho-sugar mutase [Leptospirales bacterium]|nr:phospho-sugar mutase [Leptospirales bacterium]